MSLLNLADIRFGTLAEGPGRRIAVWAQGCPRACPSCCNPEMQSLTPAAVVETAEILADFADALEEHPEIEGLTVVGGEPVLQAASMAELAAWMQERGRSVLLFTGFSYAELEQAARQDLGIQKLLKHTDLLVDGPFLSSSQDRKRPWIGSTNQQVYHLTDFYPAGIEYEDKPRSMEIHLADGYAYLNGGPFDKMQAQD